MFEKNHVVVFLALLLALLSCWPTESSGSGDIYAKINGRIETVSSGLEPTEENDKKIFKAVAELANTRLERDDEANLKGFIDLQQLSAQLCNSKGYKIVKDILNNLASYTNEPRAIEQLVHRYVTKYARDCKEIWPRNFADIIAGNPKAKEINEKIALADGLFEAVEESSPKEMNTKLIRFKSLAINDIGGKAQLVYDRLFDQTFGDPSWPYLYGQLNPEDGSVIVHDRKIKELFERKLLFPCRAYITSYGSNVFSPATLLLSFLRNDERYYYRSYINSSFFIAWRDYKLCGSLISHKEEIVAELVQIARKSLP